MRTYLYKLFVAGFSLFFFSANAYDYTENDLYFNLNSDGTVTLVGVAYRWEHDYKRVLEIPEKVRSHSVAKIGENAFEKLGSYTNEIIIPNTVTTIGNSAFKNTSITQIAIPSSVTNIGTNAFYGCNKLKRVFWNAYNCSACYSSGNYYKVFDSPLMSFDSFIIGDDVSRIPSYLVGVHCDTISMGRSLVYIGKNGLPDKPKVLIIPDLKAWMKIKYGENNVHQNPVTNCEKIIVNGRELLDLVVPDGITIIPTDAFYGYKKLRTAILPEGVKQIKSRAFCTTTKLTPDDPDRGHCGLSSISLPSTLTTIGERAFEGCRLKSVILPNSVTAIPKYAFYGCKELTSITIPNSVLSIGFHAFDECEELTSIMIPHSVTSIEAGIVRQCLKLQSIKIDPSNLYYDSREDCNGIIETSSNTLIIGCKNTRIPNSVKTIGTSAFSYVIFDQPVLIPNNLVTIQPYAFLHASFPSITIGASVAEIGKEAFVYTSPSSIHCLSLEPPVCGNNLFYQYTNTGNFYRTCVLYVPVNSIEKYRNAAEWNKFKNIIGESSGIEDIKSDSINVVELERYDINGRMLSAPQPGINIVRFSDGSVSKELVR